MVDSMLIVLGFVVGIPLAGLFSIRLFCHVMRGLRTGAAYAAGDVYKREGAPAVLKWISSFPHSLPVPICIFQRIEEREGFADPHIRS